MLWKSAFCKFIKTKLNHHIWPVRMHDRIVFEGYIRRIVREIRVNLFYGSGVLKERK